MKFTCFGEEKRNKDKFLLTPSNLSIVKLSRNRPKCKRVYLFHKEKKITIISGTEAKVKETGFRFKW